ncbi:argininosuccinate synthase [Thiospirochaeta perfilievii]|uniref:Argininosuccinate synthase n=1 Tax=Thiospirochaeta perfilievii TaxID=252967 RepID=A0A5C1QBL1_9SPIO|nr:argininosuccinate synthase [Thiospirochaeta perfilievii]QEN04259.1 argininosuccinate synthase [Thiospirochaeta perfilievii]
MGKKIKKIALAYSGGLDTSIIIPWLKEQYEGAEIIGICTNVGQDEDWANMEAKALKAGASKLYIKDIKEELAAEYIFPMVRAGAIYEGKYLLGTSIARPLQSKHQVEMALAEGCDALCHGCTGKGNDQVRFELTYKALAPELEVIAPWRVWDIQSREDAIDFANERGIELTVTKEKIYSRDWNIWHMSHEGGDLEDLWNRPKEDMFLLTKSPKDAPDKETEIIIDFEKGIPVGLNGEKMSAFSILQTLNKLGHDNGIGRKDIVETRLVGMKSRGVYETPAGTILHEAIRDLEMVTLDRDTLDLKNKLSIDYSNLVYAGKWYTTARESLEAFMAKTSEFVTGSIRVVLYKGNVLITGRKSEYSLYLEDLASFGESSYDHNDATGFINLFGLSTGVTAMVHKEKEGNSGPAAEMINIAATYHKE